MTDAKRRLRRVLGRVPGLLALARLVVATIRICMRYRVTGLASEAGFFALLSLPPLILGLVGGLAYVANAIGPVRVDAVITAVNNYASQFLTEDVIKDTLLPDDRGRRQRARASTSCRWGSCSRSGRVRAPSTCSSTPSRSCTASPASGASSAPARCPSRCTSWRSPWESSPSRWCSSGPSLLGEMLPEGWDWLIAPVLAAGHPADGRRPDQPVPRLDAAAVALAARRPRGRGDHGPVDRRLLRRPRHDRRVARRGHVDLRPAVGADRAADLAVHPGHRRAHRGGRSTPASASCGPHEEQRSLHERFAAWVGGAAPAPRRERVAPRRLGRPVRRLRPGRATTTSASPACARRRGARSRRSPAPGRSTPRRRRPRRARRGRPAGRRGALSQGRDGSGTLPVWSSSAAIG